MSAKAYVEKIAIVGAGGRIGSFIVKALLAEGKHQVTAITRPDSDSTMPAGVNVARASYDDPASLVAALKGQDALIITMNSMAPLSQSIALVEAAADAEVPWIMPNWYGSDGTNEKLGADTQLGPGIWSVSKRVEELGKSNWVALSCGFWYEWSLFGPPGAGFGQYMYGFDSTNRTVTFFDDGETKINTTTWPQVGLAVARLFALPINAEGEAASISQYKNGYIYISSFLVSQKDIFDSVKRVTKTEDEDWTISYEESITRYENAIEDVRKNGWAATTSFITALYTRLFFQNGDGNFEAQRGLANKVLSLPLQNIDDATRAAMEFSGVTA